MNAGLARFGQRAGHRCERPEYDPQTRTCLFFCFHKYILLPMGVVQYSSLSNRVETGNMDPGTLRLFIPVLYQYGPGCHKSPYGRVRPGRQERGVDLYVNIP